MPRVVGAPGSLVGTEVALSRTDRTGPEGGITLPWSHTDRPVPRLVVQPLQSFLQQETSGALVLIGAAVAALIWANSPWSASYHSVWSTHLSIGVGSASIDLSLRDWVNEGLMTLFFFVVGLEIKRELVTGELRRAREAVLPVLAAIGGMIVPALLFVAIVGADAGGGWGIAMPTDIALALAVLALAGRRAPTSLRAFLLALAIVDDLGSIVVIAIFYTAHVHWAALGVAAAAIALIALLQWIDVRATAAYVVLGIVLWVALERSGATPTLAGVAVGLLVPATPHNRPKAVSEEAHRIADETTDEPDPPDADAPQWLYLARLSRAAVSPLARAEELLHPWTSFLVLPLFALANAGVSLAPSRLSSAVFSRISLAIVVARVLGKPLGIWLASALAVRFGLARLPSSIRLAHVAALGAAAGVPFAVSLFIARLALPTALVYRATVAVLLAAVIAGVVGVIALRRVLR
jgi:Na+:H+ antiporter, NhaA family